MLVDRLRDRYPNFGFAVYAFEPSGRVTVEAHTPDIFTASAATEYEAWSALFDLSFLEETPELGITQNEPEPPDVFG